MSDTKENKPQTVEEIVSDLTPKQAAFLEEWLKTGNGVQSALKVYDTDDYNTAGQIAHQNLKKLKNPLQLLAEAQGIDHGLILRKLYEGLEATKTTNAAVLLTEDGKTMKAEEQGLIELPDYDQRGKYLDRTVDLLRLKKEKKQEQTQATQVNVYNVSGKGNSELKEQWVEFLKHKDE